MWTNVSDLANLKYEFSMWLQSCDTLPWTWTSIAWLLVLAEENEEEDEDEEYCENPFLILLTSLLLLFCDFLVRFLVDESISPIDFFPLQSLSRSSLDEDLARLTLSLLLLPLFVCRDSAVQKSAADSLVLLSSSFLWTGRLGSRNFGLRTKNSVTCLCLFMYNVGGISMINGKKMPW